ncbi:hypothetical protein ACT3CD_11560 [Geofilum sp. OHC36d9]
MSLEDPELKKTNGGWATLIAGAIVTIAIMCWNDRDGFMEGFNGGYSKG